MSHPLKDAFYESNYIATVLIENDEMKIMGGMPDKRRLNKAKRESTFCYVKEMRSNRGMKMIVVEGEWRAENE